MSEIGRLVDGTPWGVNGVLVAALAACAVIGRIGLLDAPTVHQLRVNVAYAGMLATAVGWTTRNESPDQQSSMPAWPAALTITAAVATVLHPVAAVVYLATPIWLARHASRGRLTALGLGTPIAPHGVILGLGAGTFLGAHLLVCASMTLGYRVGRGAAPGLARVLLADIGAQVLATECFFRGALFGRLQRRWSFALAAGLSTGASVARYLIDPTLPPSIELLVGAAFYMSLLGASAAWLVWRFGSLVPAIVESLVFFTAYRLLGTR